jgi:hypothetical protein
VILVGEWLMKKRNKRVSDWLADQIELVEKQGAVVDSTEIYQALREQFPQVEMTLDEVCAELVRLTKRKGLAVAFDSPPRPRGANLTGRRRNAGVLVVGGLLDGSWIVHPDTSRIVLEFSGPLPEDRYRIAYTLRRLRTPKGEIVEVLAPEGEDVSPDYLAEHHLIPEQ